METNKSQKVKRYAVGAFGTLVIPVLFYVICQIVCLSQGVSYLSRAGVGTMFFRAVAAVVLTTFALHINLNSGRFDFSLGSIALLSSVISARICLATGAPVVVMLILSIVFGIILGVISGAIYCVLRLPAIVVSLGVTLIFEGVAFFITGGYGVSFVTNASYLAFGNITTYIVITVLALLVMYLVFDRTKVGYEHKALMHGQKISVNTGIREVPNALFSYGFCGMLMGVVGIIQSTNNGSIQMALNFGSIGVMFTAFFPMFVGSFIARFSNDKLGFLAGAVSSAFVSAMYFCAGVDSSIQQIVTALILVLFVVYLSNEGRLQSLFKPARSKKEAEG